MARQMLPSLLILPPPPSPATAAAIKEAYRPPLTGALATLKSTPSSDAAVLEVVLPCPGIVDRLGQARSLVFGELENLLAKIYSLVCIICGNKSINPGGPDGVDVRIILLAYHSDEPLSRDDELPALQTVSGPIIDFPTLALTRRRWQYIFQVEGEAGLEFYARYLDIVKRTSPPVHGQNRLVRGGISMFSSAPRTTSLSDQGSVRHSVVAVGGTFDHMHAGHKLLLTATALLLQPTSPADTRPRRLIVGITGDELLKNKKYAEYLQSWKERQDAVVAFLLSILSFTRLRTGEDEVETESLNEPVANGKAIHTRLRQSAITIECVEIQDPFGPTITDESVSALVVSGESRAGGAAVNQKREERSWLPLRVFEVDVLDAEEEDDGATPRKEGFDSKISSTAIRKRIAEEKGV
ncbi:MAG: hypothetical protein M1818_002879 [Claussenomyces sp. TS43310]|nr:MAG: hypothetical protein M1818_002879 [Claussenomyces sp. TS43310]